MGGSFVGDDDRLLFSEGTESPGGRGTTGEAGVLEMDDPKSFSSAGGVSILDPLVDDALPRFACVPEVDDFVTGSGSVARRPTLVGSRSAA